MTFRGYGALTALGPVTKREVMPRARLFSLPAALSTLGDRDQERMQSSRRKTQKLGTDP